MATKRARYRCAVVACLVAGLAGFCWAQTSKPAAWPVRGNTRPFIRPSAATLPDESPPISLESLLDAPKPAPPTPATRPVQTAAVPVPVASQPASAPATRAVETLPDMVTSAPSVPATRPVQAAAVPAPVASQPASAPATRAVETLPVTVTPAPSVPATRPAETAVVPPARVEPPPAPQTVEIPEDLAVALREKAEVPITTPRGFKEPPELIKLPRDGSMLVDCRARLVNIGEGWRALVFERSPSRPEEASRYVLPSQLLEQMEQTLAREPNALFRVSGENTTYKLVSYIMLTKAIVETPQRAVPKTQPAATPATAPVAVATVATAPASAPASRPASAPASGPAGRVVDPNATTSDDILAKMLDERPGTPLIIAAQRPLKATPAVSGATIPIGAAEASQVLASPQDKWLVIDRLARIIKDDNSPWMQVHFEADNTLDDEPLRLLPATILEKAELKSMTGIKVRVSGIISQYQGRRYLLLRKVTLERSMGQF